MTQQPPLYPHTGGSAVLPAAPPSAPFDLTTPGEPEEYRVPAAYRRPYGEVVRDKRGRGYNTAFMALMCAAAAYLAMLLFAGGLAVIASIPASAALILGGKALRQRARAPRTKFYGRIGGMAWGAIISGVLSLPLLAGVLLLNSWFMSFAESTNCEFIHAGDDEAIARCIAENS